MNKILCAIVALLVLSACTATERGAATGAAIGGVGGAILDGSRGAVIGAAGGAVAGALIGRSQERSGYCRYRDRNGDIYEARCD